MPDLESALVALSGGVDSSVALLRSLETYESVRACHIDTGTGVLPEAEAVASGLGVELVVIKAGDLFENEVIEPSRKMMLAGLTPNPCALCNSRIKLALSHNILLSGEVLVTGHYVMNMEGRGLFRGKDRSKDQSYFLSLVASEILAVCRFPLGNSQKGDVLKEAESSGLPCRIDESMDLCFELSPDDNPNSAGEICDTEGRILGEHTGIGQFTIGQRKGIGAHGHRMYVIHINPASNTVVVGPEERLYSEECVLTGMNWLCPPLSDEFRALIQTRYRRKPVSADFSVGEDSVHVRFSHCEKAVAPGQIGVVYHGNRVMGGGMISTMRILKGDPIAD